MTNVKQKIVDCVKKQAVVSAQLKDLGTKHQNLTIQLQKLQGALDAYVDVLTSETGAAINDIIENDPHFKAALEAASSEGEAINSGKQAGKTTLSPQPSGVVAHKANRASQSDHVERAPRMPTIVVDDEPPMPPDDGEDDD